MLLWVNQMQTHSKRLFENDDVAVLSTHIVDVVEQPVKLMRDGKPVMVDLLGVVLSETIFHPQGGGQPADKGKLNGFEIIAVRENKEEQNPPTIYHFLDPQAVTPSQFQPGQTVELELDIEFRKQCARSHSSGHLIADAFEHDQQFSHYHAKSTQGHHFPGSEYIKVLVSTPPDNNETLCQQLNSCIDKLITASLPISNHHEGDVRHIKIGTSSRMCGGTHVKSSSELAGIKVVKIKAKPTSESKTELTVFYNC